MTIASRLNAVAVATGILLSPAILHAQLIHVHALAYGKTGCGSETALDYETSVVDASMEVTEKKRLEGILVNQNAGVTRLKSSSSKFAMGTSATSVAVISWQGGTKACPTTVISFIYGKTEDEAFSKATDHFELWAPGGASMETLELRNFLEDSAIVPLIKTQPAGITVTEGVPVTLKVEAEGPGNLEYQWRKGGEDLPFANEPELFFEKTVPTDSGVYDCLVSNEDGEVLSAPATLRVNRSVPDIQVENPVGSPLVSGLAKRSFGTVRVGRSGTARGFVIRNTGTKPLLNIGVAVTGIHKADFRTTKPLTSLAPGARAEFKVSFAPKAKGIRNAVINITSNDPDERPFRIKVAGTGATN